MKPDMNRNLIVEVFFFYRTRISLRNMKNNLINQFLFSHLSLSFLDYENQIFSNKQSFQV